MRILITNDDGVSSPALPPFIKWAMSLGEVTVVVPKLEQSGKSQAIDFHRSVEIKRVELVEGCEAYAMDSTPADCVRFAITGLHQEYDVVFSGINRGYNLGDDIAYSGTVGAIFEAARLNTKAIAFSADVDGLENALAELDRVYSYITEKELLRHAELLNVNIPTKRSKGICITKQGGIFYSDEFVECEDGKFMQVGEPIYGDCSDLSVDISAIGSGYVSVTPLTAVKTDTAAYERLRAMRL